MVFEGNEEVGKMTRKSLRQAKEDGFETVANLKLIQSSVKFMSLDARLGMDGFPAL